MNFFTQWLAILLFSFAWVSANADITLQTDDSQSLSLAPHLEILEDSTRQIRYEDLVNQANFRLNTDTHPVPGYSESAWWVRFSLHNQTAQVAERYLEFADSGEGIPNITVYVHNSSHPETSRFEVGGSVAQSQKLWDHRNVIVPLSVPPNSKTTVTVRAAGDSLKIPLFLHTHESFYASINSSMLWIGAIYGFLLVIAASNLVVYTSLRDRTYLLYACFIACFAFVLGAFDGLTGQYIFQNTRFLFTRSVNVMSSLSIGFLLLFMYEFLNLKQHSSRVWILARYAAFFAFSVGALNIFWKHNALVNITVSGCVVLCLALASRAAYLRLPFSTVFLIPIAAFLASALTTTLKQFGFLPSNFFTEEALRFGAMMSALFWTLALAYRIRETMRSNHAAQKRALELEISTQRTRLESLQNLNKFVVDISDKLNSPLLVVLRVFERLRERALNIDVAAQTSQTASHSEDIAAFFNLWNSRFHAISQSIHNLRDLSHELSQRREENIQREALEENNP